MRIVIFGTGGVGGRFGAQLAHAGEDVFFIARGAHLRAIVSEGLHVDTPEGEIVLGSAHASDDPRDAGMADAVVLAVKAWQVKEAAAAMGPIIGPHTVVLPLQNGIEAPAQLAQVLGAAHVLGGLCGTFSWIEAPGRIKSIGRVHFVKFGELDGVESERTRRLRSVFSGAGIEVEIPLNIHAAVWEKFLFVASMGGVGAVTRAPVGITRSMPGTRRLLERGMREIHAVALALRIPLDERSTERAMQLVESLDPNGTSSLQRDIAAGKPSELEAWSGAVVRAGRESGVETPLHEFIYHSLLPLEERARGRLDFV